MAETSSLENCYTRKGIESSNLSPSAKGNQMKRILTKYWELILFGSLLVYALIKQLTVGE